MSVCCVLTSSCVDAKSIIRNVWKVVWAIAYVICLMFSSNIKAHVICVPSLFSEAWQPCKKGPSRSSILGSFQAPCRSTSINVFELFFCCADVYWYAYWYQRPWLHIHQCKKVSHTILGKIPLHILKSFYV